MAKGSARKKGKKWYFRFYVEDESVNRIQKEMPGTESKSETESLLRKAMEEYENQKFVAKAANVTLADILKTQRNSLTYGELYFQNYYAIDKDKSRTYYDVHCLPVAEKVSEDFNELSLVCVRHNGAFVFQRSISVCITLRKKVDGTWSVSFPQAQTHLFK